MTRCLILAFLTITCCSTFFAPTVLADGSAKEKAVQVTGASSGIGLKITEKLAANGFYVYAGARKVAGYIGNVPHTSFPGATPE